MVTGMVSWSRARAPVGAAAPAVGPEQRSADLAAQAGDLACTQPGCTSATGLRCDYVDRRGRACRTAWCPEHRLVIDERVYCRRHAGVVSALPVGPAGQAATMPDLENRAPSLVSWVAREVDADIRELLLSGFPPGGGTELVTDPVYLVFTGGDRRRAWERAWKVVDRAGRSLRVCLLVEECADAEVAIQVNSAIVERLAPPWIVQRLYGAQPPPELDAQRRKDFNQRVFGIIRKGIDRAGQPDPASRRGPPGLEPAAVADRSWSVSPSAQLS
jgi:hypothetical protein